MQPGLPEALAATLRSALNDRCRGVLATIAAPSGESWTVGFGEDAGNAVDATFRIASVTKTFTAATVLRLVESGALSLNASISRSLDSHLLKVLADGGYDAEQIELHHLLAHTSGLPDHGSDDGYSQAVSADPERDWTPLEQIRWATERLTPVAPPGERFHYSDTGYVLLGQVVESVTADSLAAAVRRACRFDELGLASTWWERAEPPPQPEPSRARQYVGDAEFTEANPSLDLFGGGGLCSTTADLVRFFRALLDDDVVDAESLQAMLTVTQLPGNDRSMGLGAYRLPAENLDWWGHTGFWNVAAFADRRSMAAVAVAVLQHADHTRSAIDLVAEIATALHDSQIEMEPAQ